MVNHTRLTLEGAGLVIDLNDHIDRAPFGGAAAMDGIEGFGMPDVDARFFEGAGDGSLYRGGRVPGRPITLPVMFTANDRATLVRRVQRLARALSPAAGPASLRLEEDGEQWTIPVVRTGAENEKTDRKTFYSVDLVLQTTDPFWTRERASLAYLGPQVSGRGLIKGASLSKLQVSSGQIVSAITVENEGDAPAFPTITLTAPAATMRAANGAGDYYIWKGGNGTTLNPMEDPEERRIFNHKTATVVDGTGWNCYGETYQSVPSFWAIPPGTQTINIDLTGQDALTTSISISWRPRRWFML